MMILGPLLVLLGLGAMAYQLGWHPEPRQQEGKSALDVLKERYARGEIDKVEFDQKREDLER